jgi:hypothetical protein
LSHILSQKTARFVHYRELDYLVSTCLDFDIVIFFYRARSSALSPISNWITRFLYLYLPVTGGLTFTPRHRVPFSSSTVHRDMVEVL